MDKCEKEKELAWKINVEGIENIVNSSKKNRTSLSLALDMGKGTVYSRLLRDILFDIGHFDFVTLKIYLNFLKEFLHSQLSGKSDLSSESFFWAREYHERNIEGRPVYGESKGEKCKESIAYALNELRKRFRGRLNLIEVGCGPTSQFYCDDLSNCCDLNIITVDPLANHYNQLHQQYNTGYNIRCVNGYGETLAELFKKESFHLAYSQNAVDHSTSPELFVDNLYEILKPGGYLILHGFIKEGSAAKWLGLHKWDIEAQNSDLLLTNRSKSVYKKSLTRHLRMTLVSSEIKGNTYTFIFMKK